MGPFIINIHKLASGPVAVLVAPGLMIKKTGRFEKCRSLLCVEFSLTSSLFWCELGVDNVFRKRSLVFNVNRASILLVG